MRMPLQVARNPGRPWVSVKNRMIWGWLNGKVRAAIRTAMNRIARGGSLKAIRVKVMTGISKSQMLI